MPIKESRDGLNPAVTVPAAEIASPKRRTAADYLAIVVATCGVGYFPIAPGTLGALVGAGLYLTVWAGTDRLLTSNALAKRLALVYVFPPQLAVMLVVIFVISMVGIWAAS